MAKLTLTDGTIFEGTTEELIALTEKFSGKVADPVADSITHNGVEYTLVNRKAQAGDVVVFTETDSPTLKNGEYYEVSNGGWDGLVVDVGSGNYFKVYSDMFNRTESNTLVYEPKAEALKVGDYAVLISAAYRTLHGFSDGEIVEVIQNKYGEDDDDYRVKKITGEHSGYVKKSAEFVRKATDEEVAEAKASAERNAVFTQAGRKPNEYREGDIIRITKYQNGDGVGTISEVRSVYEINVGLVGGYMADFDAMEPIVFAESRLDLRK